VTVPTDGATVISSITAPNGAYEFERRVTTTPPADWASHDGRCDVVNLTNGYRVPIPCSASYADVGVDTGSNRIVIRAYARDDSRSVDSAARNVQGPREPQCGPQLCLGSGQIIDLSPTEKQIDFGQAGAGLGLMVLAVLLRFVGRRPKDDEDGTP
jgi:hypothetical protein